MKHILRWLRSHLLLVLEALRDALPLAFKLVGQICAIILRLCRRNNLPVRERRRSPDRCVPINDPAFKRADPLIYSQVYLMWLGIGVTWDNPDIQLFEGGVPVSSSSLKADTEYDVVARVWNNSTDAPVVGLPVRFTYLSFGTGTVSHPIDQTSIDLGVKGGPNQPAFAKVRWHTPPTAGHYCIQVLLDWLDDLNPANNLGQENTNLGKVHSPANFTFALGNATKERLEYRFEADAYTISPRDPCDKQRDPTRPGADELQLDLFKDYANNVALYPQFQEYFRKYQPPFLAVWGKNDPFFLPAGAEAFKRDIPKDTVQFFDTGHFALETHCREIAEAIVPFLARAIGS